MVGSRSPPGCYTLQHLCEARCRTTNTRIQAVMGGNASRVSTSSRCKGHSIGVSRCFKSPLGNSYGLRPNTGCRYRDCHHARNDKFLHLSPLHSINVRPPLFVSLVCFSSPR